MSPEMIGALKEVVTGRLKAMNQPVDDNWMFWVKTDDIERAKAPIKTNRVRPSKVKTVEPGA